MMAGRGKPDRGVDGGLTRHIPVMLPEIMQVLQPRDGAIYVDGTFGAGGYTSALLEAADCVVIAIDRDPQAIETAHGLAARYRGRLHVAEGRYSDMVRHAASVGIGRVDGVALDIGVSSMQIDQPERGFSFMADGPLDMRMERDGISAADVVNTAREGDLADIIYLLGEERRSRAVARAIVRAREDKAIERTGELAAIVARVVAPLGRDKKHPATRTFQALRAYVNGELGELGGGLYAAEALLGAGGKLAVVTFHSLEERVVKQFFVKATGREAAASRHMPANPDRVEPTFESLSKGALKPSEAECAANTRARSARLRAGLRTAAPARKADLAALGLPDLPPVQHRAKGVPS